MRNRTILLAAVASLAAACSGAPPSTSPPQPTETLSPPAPTSTTHPTATPPPVLPRLTLEGNEVMWSGDPPPLSDCRITFCDAGVILEALIPLSGLAQPAYVSDDFGDRTIRRAEVDGDGFTLSVERECPVPPTLTPELPCTLEAVEEYMTTVSPLIATSNDDLEQFLSMLPGLIPYQAEYLWDDEVYGEIVNRDWDIQSQLWSMNIPACLREVHDATRSAMGYRSTVFHFQSNIPFPSTDNFQVFFDAVDELLAQSEAEMQRAGDLMATLLLERFGVATTPTP